METLGSQWRTKRGLAVGDEIATQRQLYRRASRRMNAWGGTAWLLDPYRTICLGD